MIKLNCEINACISVRFKRSTRSECCLVVPAGFSNRMAFTSCAPFSYKPLLNSSMVYLGFGQTLRIPRGKKNSSRIRKLFWSLVSFHHWKVIYDKGKLPVKGVVMTHEGSAVQRSKTVNKAKA